MGPIDFMGLGPIKSSDCKYYIDRIVERRWAMMVQSLLHDFLAFWIQGRRGFVKQENLGVPDLGAGNSHTLLLKS